jgi:FixJ family two-component response regulator
MPEARMISIIDDDAHVLDAIQRLVRSLGYGAVTFQSADDFLQSGRVAETACLILDIQMPGLSGLELQERLLAEGHKTPVIFITALPERFRARALANGAAGFLSKPFSAESLIDCLTAVLADQKQ